MNDDLKEFADILFAPRERDELRNRINKAIEYIEKHKYPFLMDHYSSDVDNLLDILKGSDKDE